MSILPSFEVGFAASTMTDDEMRDLDDALRQDDFWIQHKQIMDLVDRYIEVFWRLGKTLPMFVDRRVSFSGSPSVRESIAVRRITVRVPPGLSEDTTRLLAEMQLREQWFDCFEYDDDSA